MIIVYLYNFSFPNGWSLLFSQPLPLPKMDFWGIRLPHEKKSTGGQALLRGIVQCFEVGFLWDTSKV
jgi:hypothetical protein